MNNSVIRAAVVAGLLLGGVAAARAADEADFERLTNQRGAACVTIKYVLKVKGAQGEFEDERESSGVMIEADGLVLTANSQLGGGPFVRAGVSAIPTNIKVLIGDDTQGVDARVIARDTELDLSWLKLKDVGEKKFEFVDLSKAAPGKLGDRLYTFMRLGKFFDRAMTVRETRIGGTTKKPRSLYIPSPGVGGLGLPMFNAEGEIVAFTVLQLPDAEELEAATSMTAYTGGNGILLPAAEVAKATARAKEADTGEDAAAEGESAEGEASSKPAESEASTKPVEGESGEKKGE